MPIAISPIDRKLGTMLRKLFFERRNQFAHLLVDGALAFEVVVMFGDGEHALAGNVASAEDVLKEGNDVFAGFWSAERDDQDAVVLHERWPKVGYGGIRDITKNCVDISGRKILKSLQLRDS